MSLRTYKKWRWYGIALVTTAVLLSCAYMWYSIGSFRYDSPDETANAYFTQRVIEGKGLRVCEPPYSIVEDAPHPRSTAIRNGCLVPGSFLGQDLFYGIFGLILGNWVVPLLSSLLTIAALVGLFDVFRRVMGKRRAVFGVVLAGVQPAFLLFASRPYYHNILFLDFLIFALASLFRAVAKNDLRWYGLSGFFVGLALSVRTSEALWVLPILLLTAIVPKWRSWKGVFVAGAFLLLAMLPVFWANTAVFGVPWRTAYTLSVDEGSGQLSDITARLVLPFGTHPVAAMQAVNRYILGLMPWIGLPLLFGILVAVRTIRRLSSFFRWYTIAYLCMSGWLILYYGSWQLAEYNDPTLVFLSSSYIRYWLPIFVFGTPFIVLGIEHIHAQFMAGKFAFLRTTLLLGLITVLSVNLAYADPLHGLIAVRSRVQQYKATSDAITDIVRPADTIIAGFHDKVFFPDRSVVVNLPENATQRRVVLHQLWQRGRLYLFQGVIDEPAIQSGALLRAEGHVLTSVKTVDEGTLYRVEP